MLQTFRDHYRDAVEREGQSGVAFWVGVVADVGASVVREHRTALRERVISMRKRVVIGWAVGLPVVALTVGLVAHQTVKQPYQTPFFHLFFSDTLHMKVWLITAAVGPSPALATVSTPIHSPDCSSAWLLPRRPRGRKATGR